MNDALRCEQCGKHPATVHWTEMVNSAVRKLHLCEACAAAKGLDVNNPAAFSKLLLGLGPAPSERARKQDEACPECHLRASDFKKTSRLGCAACYTRFAADLAPLLASMHKGTRHAGKVPSKVRVPAGPPPSLASLRQALEAAVAAEQYEDAARLRDQIRRLTEREAAPPGSPAAGGA